MTVRFYGPRLLEETIRESTSKVGDLIGEKEIIIVTGPVLLKTIGGHEIDKERVKPINSDLQGASLGLSRYASPSDIKKARAAWGRLYKHQKAYSFPGDGSGYML